MDEVKILADMRKAEERYAETCRRRDEECVDIVIGGFIVVALWIAACIYVFAA